MPNTGKPSTGCEECRRKKVKCDERRPGCERCERARRVCPGYRDVVDRFVNMNKDSKNRALYPPRRRSSKLAARSPSAPRAASAQSDDRRSPHLSEAMSEIGSQDQASAPASRRSSPSGSSHAASALPVMIASSIPTEWEDVAVNYYMTNFVVYASENMGRPGHFDFLPELIKQQNDATCLITALKSVAFSALGNRSCLVQLNVEARQLYTRALAQVNVALSNPSTVRADATLATLVLLGQYEIISGDQPASAVRTSHTEGQATLLSLRGPDQFASYSGRELFRLTQQSLQMCALSGERSEMPLHEGVPMETFRHPIAQNFYDGNVKIFELRNQAAAIKSKGWQDADWCEELSSILVQQEMALTTLNDLVEASRTGPTYWFYPLANVSRDAAYLTSTGDPSQQVPSSRQIYVFATVMLAHAVLHLWAVEALLLEDMIDTADALDAAGYTLPPPQQPEALHRQLERCIDDLCATIPYILGEIDARGNLCVGGQGKVAACYGALWPLHVLYGLPALGHTRRAWVGARLTQIGTVYGIRRALYLREGRRNNQAEVAIRVKDVDFSPGSSVHGSKARESPQTSWDASQ